jgi:hypothetical protein
VGLFAGLTVCDCGSTYIAESFLSTLEHEVLSRHTYVTNTRARTVVLAWCHEFYNTAGGTAAQRCALQLRLRKPPLTKWQRHKEASTILGESHPRTFVNTISTAPAPARR